VGGEATWLLAGAGLPTLAEDLFGRLPEGPGAEVAGELAGAAARVVRRRDRTVPVAAVHAAAAVESQVAEALREAGAKPVSEEAFEALRVAAGVPRYGADFDDRHFPQETGMDDGMSYTKGCYLGQEVVARIHYRGHVNHQLRALVFDGEAPEPGTELSLEGEAVGRLGSVANTAGGTLGLAILHRKAAEPGTRVVGAGGQTARVEPAGLAAAATS
jgi:folate-binding protein YgfZ